MAKNGSKITENKTVKPETLQRAFELQRIGNRAVKKAQEENRRLGIPNWYSINGVIISDQELSQKQSDDKSGSLVGLGEILDEDLESASRDISAKFRDSINRSAEELWK